MEYPGGVGRRRMRRRLVRREVIGYPGGIRGRRRRRRKRRGCARPFASDRTIPEGFFQRRCGGGISEGEEEEEAVYQRVIPGKRLFSC